MPLLAVVIVPVSDIETKAIRSLIPLITPVKTVSFPEDNIATPHHFSLATTNKRKTGKGGGRA